MNDRHRQRNETQQSFEEDVTAALGRVLAGLAQVIAAVPEPVADSADLHRALNIHKKVSWKVYRAATAANPLAAGPHIPTPAVLKTFLDAAVARGVRKETVAAAKQAASDLKHLIDKYAGDRETFESMVSSLLDRQDAEQVSLAHRRLVFRGLKHILGVQAKTHLKLSVYQPAENPMMLDYARVEGFLSLRQLRGDAPFAVSHACTWSEGGVVQNVRREPLDPTSGSDRMSLIREFSSQPTPEFREVQGASGWIDGELVSQGIGKCSAITCFEGHVVREIGWRYQHEGDDAGRDFVGIRTPCEALVFDMMVREGTFGHGRISPEGLVCCEHVNNFLDYTGEDPRQRPSLRPTIETVSYLGKGPSVLQTQDFPRYSELGQYVFDRLGWDGERFDVYRCRIEYPVVPSTVLISFDLPVAEST